MVVLEKSWQKYMFLVVFCFVALLISGCVSTRQNDDNHHNAVVNYGNGQEIEVYEEYPFRRLNDLNTHYVMRHGNEVYIEKVVDVTTGNVYYLTMSGSYGAAVSISPVYDSDGKIMNLKPKKEEKE